jgi:hypothetical protein
LIVEDQLLIRQALHQMFAVGLPENQAIRSASAFCVLLDLIKMCILNKKEMI